MSLLTTWHIITCEYPPRVGGVSDYSQLVAEGLADAGDEVHVWCPSLPQVAVSNGVNVHPDLGCLAPRDLRAVDHLLDGFAPPRRLLVQWVPHGFGYHSMNLPFCLWLHQRARRGDCVDLMVHEPYLAFRRGPLRHVAMAVVHRLMTVVLLNAASRIWIATPAWQRLLCRYTLGRNVPFAWLPISSSVRPGASERAQAIRKHYLTDGDALIGHFGTFGPPVAPLLREQLAAMIRSRLKPSFLLVGVGSEGFRADLIDHEPAFSGRLHATGVVAPSDLGSYLRACDLVVQPYPDGITARRTSAIASLSLGIPIVTTNGHLTESFWSETGAVLLADVTNPLAFTQHVERLLGDESERRRVGERGRALYERRFDLRYTIAALRNGQDTERTKRWRR